MSAVPDLKELHRTLLSMLKDIDAVCRKHGIKYFLMCGSLLGAVRHSGFIPWDDDLDIGFLREDYERFLGFAEEELDKEKYYIQREFSKDWSRTFSKVRLNGTTYIESIVYQPNVHQGLFIDLFPIDNLAQGNVGVKLQWLAYRGIRRKYSDIPEDGLSPLKRIKHLFTKILPGKLLLAVVQRKRDNHSEKVHMYLGASAVKKNNEFYREDFELAVEHSFEDMSVLIPCGWDRILRTEFKDYMKIPPVEKQIARIHAKYYDLHRDYREYLKEEIDKNA